jgi:hypothetical protein
VVVKRDFRVSNDQVHRKARSQTSNKKFNMSDKRDFNDKDIIKNNKKYSTKKDYNNANKNAILEKKRRKMQKLLGSNYKSPQRVTFEGPTAQSLKIAQKLKQRQVGDNFIVSIVDMKLVTKRRFDEHTALVTIPKCGLRFMNVIEVNLQKPKRVVHDEVLHSWTKARFLNNYDGNFYWKVGTKAYGSISEVFVATEGFKWNYIPILKLRGGMFKGPGKQKITLCDNGDKLVEDHRGLSLFTKDGMRYFSFDNETVEDKKEKGTYKHKCHSKSNKPKNTMHRLNRSAPPEGMPQHMIPQKVTMQGTGEQEKDPKPIKDPDEYMANAPYFQHDKRCKLNIRMSNTYSQIQYQAMLLKESGKEVRYDDAMTGTFPEDNDPNKENICMKVSAFGQKSWYPFFTTYDSKMNHAYVKKGDIWYFVYMAESTYVVKEIGTHFSITSKKTPWFSELIGIPMPFAYQYTQHIAVHNEMVPVPKPVISFAIETYRNRKLNEFTLNSVTTEIRKWYHTTPMFALLGDMDERIYMALYFFLTRTRTAELTKHIKGSMDTFYEQSENNDVLLNPPKYPGLYGFFKKLIDVFCPPAFRDWVAELNIAANIAGVFTGMGKWFMNRVTSFITFSGGMYVFKFLPWQLSTVVEELIKTIPGGALFIAGIEAFKDYMNNMPISIIISKFVIHSFIEIFSPMARLIMLPFRIAVHWLWNWTFHNDKMKIETLPKEDIEFGVSPKTFARTKFKTSIDQPIPKDIKNQKILEQMKDEIEPKKNSIVYTTFSSQNFTAPEKTNNNIVNAYIKRNAQPQPKEELDEKIHEAADNFIKMVTHEIEPFYQEVSTEEWIELTNHTGGKKKIYRQAWEQVKREKDFSYESNIEMKANEVLPDNLARTIHAFDPKYVVTVAPEIKAVANAYAKRFDGTKPIKMPDGKLLYLMYAAKGATKEVNEAIDYFRSVCNKGDKLLISLGDDTKLVYDHMGTLCTDFSRYDSTQNYLYHYIFRSIVRYFNIDVADHLFKAYMAKSKLSLYDAENWRGELIDVTNSGFKTGCPETSIANTITTMFCYWFAMHASDDPKTIVNILNQECGLIAKAKEEHLETGSEFLKHIFIISDEITVSAPLLSSWAKVGKFTTDPKLFVPLSKLKSENQIAIDATAMQMRGKGNWEHIAYFKEVVDKVYEASKTNAVYKENEYSIETDTPYVDAETLLKAYHNRYGLDTHEIKQFFWNLTSIDMDSLPCTYTSKILDQAVTIDYGDKSF